MNYIKILFIIIYFFIVQIDSSAQSKKMKFADQLVIGTSLTYVPDHKKEQYRYHEWTWSLNAAVNINRRLMLGLNHLYIQSHGSRVSKDQFNLFGIFSQYDFLAKSKHRLYGEFGLYKGNYCTCGTLDPYKEKGLTYGSFGGGYELPLGRRFNVEFAFLGYRIWSKTELPDYAYTQYVLGINYILSK